MQVDPEGNKWKKMKNYVNRGHQGSPDPILELWDPLRISATLDARYSKFDMQVESEGN